MSTKIDCESDEDNDVTTQKESTERVYSEYTKGDDDDSELVPKVMEQKDADNNDIDELTSALARIDLLSATTPVSDPVRRIAEWVSTSHRILVLSGAGVSVSAGIPDFRTPGTGLYDNLQKYNLPYPEAVFDLNFYRRNPHPFLSLAKEIWPGGHAPTLTHSFLTVLAKQRRLLRNYSQNIDGLEYLAQLPPDKLVECHGHFRTASCIRCGTPANAHNVKTCIFQGQVPTCHKCHSYVKPDIVFFGEGLPDRYHQFLRQDLPQADLCLILGTSLQVAPVSMIPDMVPRTCKRVLLNREFVGDLDDAKRDLFLAGDCDDSIRHIAHVLGWTEELQQTHALAKAAIEAKGAAATASDKPTEPGG